MTGSQTQQQAASVVQYASMPTQELVQQFQQSWAVAREEIENDNLQVIEPMITSLVSRLIGKVESEAYLHGNTPWASLGGDFQKDLARQQQNTPR